jgi:hypothetical protein
MIPFGPWTPDRPEQTDTARRASGVYATVDGYAPIAQTVATALTPLGRVQGAYSARDVNQTPYMFAGTANRLHRRSDAGDWAIIADGLATPATGRWDFERFGRLVVATNGVDPIQRIDLLAGGAATPLGNAPRGKYLAVVRAQLFAGNVQGNPYRLDWSGVGNSEEWTPGLDSAGSTELASGGAILGLNGGEYGLVFQENAIKRLSPAAGDELFQVDEIERNHGLFTPGALAKYGQFNFYISQNGFYLCDGTGSRPIGDQKVDATFQRALNYEARTRIASAVDPIRKLVVWLYPSGASSRCNAALIYSWAVDRWSEAPLDLDYVAAAYTSGISPDDPQFPEPLPDSDTGSWDDIAYASTLLVGAFDADGRFLTFSGPPMPAVLESGEFQPFALGRARARGFRVVGGPVGALGSVGARARSGDAVVYTTPSATNKNGYVCARTEGRLLRARVTTSAGLVWSHIQGIEPDLSEAGRF